jgi:ATP-dependent Lon protease
MNSTEVVQMTLPALCFKGLVALPNNEIRVELARNDSARTIKEIMDTEDKMLVVLSKNKFLASGQDQVDFNNIGVIGKIIAYTEVGNIRRIVIKTIVRCQVDSYLDIDPIIRVSVTTKPSYSTSQTKELACVRLLVQELDQNARNLFKQNPDVIKKISDGITPEILTDLFAHNLNLDFNKKLLYLNTIDTTERMVLLLSDVRNEKEVLKIEEEIDGKVRENVNENQKEFYLREKMKVIQEELGDKAKKESDIEDLRKKILDCKMPKSMEEKALNELSRYSMLSAASGESSIARTYLDFIVSLPWSKASVDCDDLVKAKQQLDIDHYGLNKVKDRILEYLAVCIMTKKTPQAILCLVGPPGVGKTSLAKSIAKAMNKQFVKQSLGGVKDESEIRGHRRTYLGALPGRILQGMKRAGTINPVFLLDEIDKLTSDYRGDPASAMLEVLDGEQNHAFSDNYLEEPYDLSKVFFIATANYLENIPPALRDRLEIVELSSYTEFEKFEIAKIHLIDKQLQLHGLSKCDFKLTDEALWMLIREYTREAGVRELERYIGTLIRKAIKTILLDKTMPIVIDENNISSWIGKPRYSYTKLDEIDQVGIVTGLAYTQYGGDTLPIEATCYKGDGRLILTGKLGDVMKESGQAALSYVKNHCKNLNIDPDIFKINDIHIHVPEGAVPKDGPSAGVALTTAIASLLSNKKVDHTLGMTGEVTLRGRVLPIGGLREKSIAAHRSGLKKILIPIENVKDIEDVPATVLEQLQIIPVATVEEVLNIALID